MSNLFGQRSTNNDSSIPVTASNKGDRNLLDVNNPNVFSSDFGELLTADRHTIFNLKPTWGLSTHRDDTSATTGTGALVDELDGEFRLQTGTATSNVAEITTNERGVYRPGLMGQFGVGVRIPTLPSGTQDVKWGYFDENNGFGFGVDADSSYVFRRTNSTDTQISQSDWNIDKLDGTGPSGLTLDLSDGNIFHGDFTWYGYGNIVYSVIIRDGIYRRRVPIHSFDVDGEATIIDPNQPITVRAENGASSSSNLSVFVGGRQFSVIGGRITTPKRTVSEINSLYSLTASQDTWEPIILMRRKENHGASNRKNSVNVSVSRFQAFSDDDTEFRLTVGGSSSGSAWSTPSDTTSVESAVETIVPAGGMSISGSLITSLRGYVADSQGKSVESISLENEIALANSQEAILWAKPLTGNATVVTGILHWHEEW